VLHLAAWRAFVEGPECFADRRTTDIGTPIDEIFRN
jgi:hypothetical protein